MRWTARVIHTCEYGSEGLHAEKVVLLSCGTSSSAVRKRTCVFSPHESLHHEYVLAQRQMSLVRARFPVAYWLRDVNVVRAAEVTASEVREVGCVHPFEHIPTVCATSSG